MKDQNAEERPIAGHSLTDGLAVCPTTEGITAEKAHHSTESLEGLSPIELRQMLHDLKRQKIELEAQNTELLRNVSRADSLPDEQSWDRNQAH